MISDSSRPYIEASIPVLRQYGKTITELFYANMLGEHPELKQIFNMGNQANGTQKESLAAAVFAYAANIDNPAAIMPVAARIAHKHASVGILPAHYPIVGKHLLGAIKAVLGVNATPELISAWDEAYWLLAGELIAAEARLYHSHEGKEKQWLNAVILDKERVAEDIYSIRLSLASGDALPEFVPGQYISVRGHLPKQQLTQIRQYSLSQRPHQDSYRITVKHEIGEADKPTGMFSDWLINELSVGDKVEISHPYGTFTPDLNKDSPLVLISNGVGLTPMLSVIHTIISAHPEKPVMLLHAAESEKAIPHLAELVEGKVAHRNLQYQLFLKQDTHNKPTNQKLDARQVNFEGWEGADFYLCGSIQFMDSIISQLVEIGIQKKQIHREVFGPENLSQLV